MSGLHSAVMTSLFGIVALSTATAEERATDWRDRAELYLDFQFVADPMVQDELKLSVDQRPQIMGLVKSYRSSVPGPSKSRAEMTPEERGKFDEERKLANERRDAEYAPKLVATLTRDQYGRLRELQIQNSLWSFGPSAADETRIAKPLNLSDEQRTQLRKIRQDWLQTLGKKGRPETEREQRAKYEVDVAKRDEAANAVLTPEQRAKLVEIQGKPFDIQRLRDNWLSELKKERRNKD